MPENLQGMPLQRQEFMGFRPEDDPAHRNNGSKFPPTPSLTL
ncbi:MAG: hypothetical protein ACO36E_07120 [Synechocystis sp.]